MSNRARTVLAVVALAAVALNFVGYSLFVVFNYDEVEAIHSAWLVKEGGTPYVDFFQHHHPLLYYCLVPVITICGETAQTAVAARVFQLVTALAIFFVTWRIALELFDRTVATYAVILLGTTFIFVTKVIEVRPDVQQTLFGLIAVRSYLRYFEQPRRRHMIVAGASLALSFLFLQKALFLMAALGACFVVRWVFGHIRGRDAWWAVGSFAGVLGSFYALILICVSWDLYWLTNWSVNVTDHGAFGPFFRTVQSMERNPVLWVFFALGLVTVLRRRDRIELGVLALAMLGTLVVYSRPWPQYYLPAIPLMAIIAAAGLLRNVKPGLLVPASIVALGSIPVAYEFCVLGYTTNGRQLELMQTVLDETSPDDHVYDGRAEFNLFRPDLDYFWFSVSSEGCLERWRKLRPYDYDVYALIDAKQPAILNAAMLRNEKQAGILETYRVHEKFDHLLLRKR